MISRSQMCCTSVILPVRNGGRYVAEAMRSTLDQLDKGDEVIVIDDASSDDTLPVVTAIADARVRVLSAPGLGVSTARNIGLSAARGEFVAFLDHDDLWPAGRQEVMLRLLRQDPEIDAVFGRIRLLFAPGIAPLPQYLEMDGTFFPHICAGLYRRRLLDRIDGFAVDMPRGGDIDYYLRLTEAGMRARLCEIDGLIYRRHDANITNDLWASRRGFFEMLRRKVARARQSSTPDA